MNYCLNSKVNRIYKKNSYTKGIDAENLVRKYYESFNFKHISSREKNSYGEIDLIMQSSNLNIVFVEVKFRYNKDFFESLPSKQINRIKNAAECFLSANPNLYYNSIRFNLAFVYSYNQKPEIIRNIFFN